jgi:hypothetical protein
LRRERGQLSPLAGRRALIQMPSAAGSFKLSENLTLIRVKYGQKASPAANRAFKPLC